MYFNEVLLGDNNMLVVLDGVKLSYLTQKERSKFFRIVRERIARRKEALNV